MSLSLCSAEELQLLETLAVRHISQSLVIQWTLIWNLLTCMCEARTLLNWDQLQTLSIASRVPRFIHTRIPSVEANISSCWVICPGLPVDSLLLRAPLTCEDDLNDLSSHEWLYFWLHWSSYKKIVAYVEFSKHVTLLLLRDLIFSLLTAYFMWIWVCTCSLSYSETSDKILKRNRNKVPPVPLVLLKHKAESHILDLL